MPDTENAPTPAERVRTLLANASSVVLDIPGVDLTARPGLPPLVDCAVLPDGALAVLVETDSPLHRIAAIAALTRRAAQSEAPPHGRHAAQEDAWQDEPAAELEAVDVAPVALPHRIRGRALAQGRLTLPAPGEPFDTLFPRVSPAGRTQLRLELDHLAVDDLRGFDCCIDLAAFTAAAADPVAAEEAGLLQHLDAAHADQLDNLGRRALGSGAAATSWAGREPVRVRPVALDRYGLRVRMIGADGNAELMDARFDFLRPLDGPEQLPEAMHRLFAQVRNSG
ncbi:DUF2470 domain-containing protein [Kitasatospora cinereorecta]|uniref:DUF2470 domain-containing protein n=1 Tax=Kitasatospora cinereorecta TaxID=285560 RepID=A0ABW0VQ00_9ACTN